MPDFTTIKYSFTGKPEKLNIERLNPYEAECRLFVESVNKGQENNSLSAQAAINAIITCLKAEESLKSGNEVTVK